MTEELAARVDLVERAVARMDQDADLERAAMGRTPDPQQLIHGAPDLRIEPPPQAAGDGMDESRIGRRGAFIVSERYGPDDPAEWETNATDIGKVRFGKPTAAYTSGATFTLNPCDAAGTDNGEANETVQAGWTLPANTEIPTTAIVPFVLAADGLYYVLGVPREVITNIQYDTTSHKIQKKVRYDFGAFATTESSAWVDVTTAVDCTA